MHIEDNHVVGEPHLYRHKLFHLSLNMLPNLILVLPGKQPIFSYGYSDSKESVIVTLPVPRIFFNSSAETSLIFPNLVKFQEFGS